MHKILIKNKNINDIAKSMTILILYRWEKGKLLLFGQPIYAVILKAAITTYLVLLFLPLL